MPVRIGINPITWTNDDMPELGGDTPLETCLAETAAAGYAGTEMGNKFPRDTAGMRAALVPHRLALVSGWYSANLLARSAAAEIATVAPHLKLLREMRCGVIVFCETTGGVAGDRHTPVSRRPKLDAAGWREFLPKLNAVANHVAAAGVRMAYHHHMGTVIETADEIDRLMEGTGPEVGLLLDTGHLAYAGAEPLEVLKRWGARVNHVHCKDVRAERLAAAKARDLSFMDAVVEGVFTVPGDGSIDYAPILAELKRLGYGGWLVVEAEQDPKQAHPLTYATMGYRNLSAAAHAAGLA